MKKIIKKIKIILGLELPYLLEEEEVKEPIVFKNTKENIIAIPKNAEVRFYKNTELENSIKQFTNCVINSGMTANEARELLRLRRK